MKQGKTTKSVESSTKEILIGSQTPSVRVSPSYETTDGKDAYKILKACGLNLDEWQQSTINDFMARDESRMWSAPTCGLSVPRQNGKTLVIAGRAGAGMVLYNEWIIYTAHLQKTATETFLELRGLFETAGLSKYIKEIKAAQGREEIILKSGGKIKFLARTRNGGRGIHGDCLIFDEAQELTYEQQASFIPVLSASKRPQTIYLGTPPDENCFGDVFRKIRNNAITGESKKTAWTEFSVDKIGDISDRKRWAIANPAFGVRILETTIETEFEQLSTDDFARERLGYWNPVQQEKIDYAIDKEAFNKCKSNAAKPEGKTAYGVKFSADGLYVTLAGAVIPSEGKAMVSLIAQKPITEGLRWLGDWLNERQSKASCVVIDGRNGVEVLVDRISSVWRAKGSIIKPNAKDVVAAASLLCEELNEGSVTWNEKETVLEESALTSIKRPIGGGWGFGGDNSPPIEAAALALWGARNSKRDPSRKMRIG